MFNKILVAVDGSQKSFQALDAACEVQKKFGSKMIIISVYKHYGALEASLNMAPTVPGSPDESLAEYTTKIVEAAKQRAQKNGVTEVKGIVKSGRPARTIVKYADEKKIDLIVMGGRGLGDFEGLLLGSISHKVISLSKCACLTI